MGVFGTSNGTVMGAVQQQGEANFKTVNNLLSLQENHVEEMIKKVASELKNYWITQEHEDKPGESHFENFSIREY